ncbi:MAG: hypothetical protein ABI619_06965, partial [Betaproteobacteria bacterium]
LSESQEQVPQLEQALAALVTDESTSVRLQLAATLGDWKSPSTAKCLAQLALHDAQDSFFRATLLSSINPQNVADVFAHLLPELDRIPAELNNALLELLAAYDERDAVLEVINRLPLNATKYTTTQLTSVARIASARRAIVPGGTMVSLLSRIKTSPRDCLRPRFMPPAKPLFVSLRTHLIEENFSDVTASDDLVFWSEALSTTTTSQSGKSGSPMRLSRQRPVVSAYLL